MIARYDDIIVNTKFFSVPIKKHLNINCNIPIPENHQRLERFFKSYAGSIYLGKVKLILDRLKAMAASQVISSVALDIFFSNLNHTENSKNHFPYDAISFQLFTDGIRMLSCIVDKLELPDVNEELKNQILTMLGSELSVCAPGCYTIIQNAYLKLSNNPEINLLDVRTEIAQQTALELISQHNSRLVNQYTLGRLSKPDLDAMIIYEGNITHYVSAILNQHQHPFGLEHNPDVLVTSVDQVAHFFDSFREIVNKQLTFYNVMDYIIDHKIRYDECIENIRQTPTRSAEYMDQLCSQLDAFGKDPKFKVTDLFDQERMDKNEFVASLQARQYLQSSLIFRFNEDRFIDISRVTEQLKLEDNVELVYFVNMPIEISYVNIGDSIRQPLTLYCFDILKSTGAIPVVLDSVVHQNQLHREIIKQISADPISLLIPHHLTDDNDIIQFYVLLVSNERHSFFLKIIDLMPEDIKDNFISYFQALCRREEQMTVERLTACIVESIKAVNFQFITVDQMKPVNSIVENIADLHNILCLTPDSLRYQLLLMINPTRLRLLLSSSLLNDVCTLILCFSHELRFQLLVNFHYCGNIFAALKTVDELGWFLSAIPPDNYQDFLAFLLGSNKLRILIPNLTSFTRLLSLVPENSRMQLIQLVGLPYCLDLSCANIANFGYILSSFTTDEQIKLLSLWYGDDTSILFPSIEYLIAFVSTFSVTSRGDFILKMPDACLQKISSSQNELLQLMPNVLPSHYKRLITKIGDEKIKEMLPDSQALLGFLHGLPAADYRSFIPTFASILQGNEVERYRELPKNIYNELLQYQPHSVLSQVSSYIGSIFYSSQPTDVSHRQQASSRTFDV